MELIYEDNVKTDPARVGFPALIMCMGLAVEMEDGAIVGCHVTPLSDETALLATFRQAIVAHGGLARLMYCAGHYQTHTDGGGSVIDVKARAIGFRGTVNLLDLDRRPDAGVSTYVEMASVNGNVRVRYKRQSKIEYVQDDGEAFNAIDANVRRQKVLLGITRPGKWHGVGATDMRQITIA